jgi:hypothetical protein
VSFFYRILAAFFLALFLLAGERVASQEMLGIMNSTYSGINGAIINPASPVASPYYLDINLLSAHLFAENNYIYLAKDEYRFKRFFQNNPEFPTHPPDNKPYYDYYNVSSKKGFLNVRLMIPSASIVIGKHAFGIYGDVRSATSARNFSYEMAKFLFEGFTFPPQYDINYIDDRKMSAANLEWTEYAFNYSYAIKNVDQEYWTVGVTVKSLQGYAGGYITSKFIDYLVPDADTLIVNNATGEAGIALPLNYHGNAYINSPLYRGKGLGFDLGITFQQKQSLNELSSNFTSLCSQPYIPYRYKIGISLLDIGRIRFTDNAIKYAIDNRSTIWSGINEVDFVDINDLADQISNHFYGNNTQLVAGNEIKIGLPTAASVQADYNFKGNWFVNGTAVYPIKLWRASVVRPPLFAVSPRYETSTFGIGMVASLYDWSILHIGLNARYKGFFIGSEKLSAFFHFTNFTGLDIYAGIKISFLKGKCRSYSNASCGNNEYVKYQKKKKKSDSLKFR